MKRLFFLFLFVPLITFSQAPKKSNVIEIFTSQSEDEALKTMGRLLIDSNFTLETIDKDFYMLSTKMKSCSYGMMNAANIDVKLKVAIDKTDSGSKLKLTGIYNSPDFAKYTPDEFERHAMKIENVGGKSSMSGASWKIMNDLALKFTDADVKYVIE